MLNAQRKEEAASADSSQSDADAMPHDRSMAAINVGGIQVDIVGTPQLLRSELGRPKISLDARKANGETLEVQLWEEATEPYLAQASWMKPTPATPLRVSFEGNYRKHETHLVRGTKQHRWTFNAKEFHIDWTSPAARKAYKGSIELRVTGITPTKPRPGGKPGWAVDGLTPNGQRTRIKLNAHEGTNAAAARLRGASPNQPIEAKFEGSWIQGRTEAQKPTKLFIAGEAEVPELHRQAQPQPQAGIGANRQKESVQR